MIPTPRRADGPLAASALGVRHVAGLAAALGERVVIGDGGAGVVIALDREGTWVAALDGGAASGPVRAAGGALRVAVGPARRGRTVDPLGRPRDDRGPVLDDAARSLWAPSLARAPLPDARESIPTGILPVDTRVFPVRGEQHLVLGPPGTEPGHLAARLASAWRDTFDLFVFVLVGSGAHAERHEAVRLLRDRAVVVVASPDAPAQRALAPRAGLVIAGEAAERGARVLCVLDDVTDAFAAQRALDAAVALPGAPPPDDGERWLCALSSHVGAFAGGGSVTAVSALRLGPDAPLRHPREVEVRLVFPQIVLEAGSSEPRVDHEASCRGDLLPRMVPGPLRLRGVLAGVDRKEREARRLWARLGTSAPAADQARGARLAALRSALRARELSQEAMFLVLAAVVFDLAGAWPTERLADLADAIVAALPTAPAVTAAVRAWRRWSGEQPSTAIADFIASLPAPPAPDRGLDPPRPALRIELEGRAEPHLALDVDAVRVGPGEALDPGLPGAPARPLFRRTSLGWLAVLDADTTGHITLADGEHSAAELRADARALHHGATWYVPLGAAAQGRLSSAPYAWTFELVAHRDRAEREAAYGEAIDVTGMVQSFLSSALAQTAGDDPDEAAALEKMMRRVLHAMPFARFAAEAMLRGLDDAELDQAAAFARTPAGRKAGNPLAALDAFVEALDQWIAAWVEPTLRRRAAELQGAPLAGLPEPLLPQAASAAEAELVSPVDPAALALVAGPKLDALRETEAGRVLAARGAWEAFRAEQLANEALVRARQTWVERFYTPDELVQAATYMRGAGRKVGKGADEDAWINARTQAWMEVHGERLMAALDEDGDA